MNHCTAMQRIPKCCPILSLNCSMEASRHNDIFAQWRRVAYAYSIGEMQRQRLVAAGTVCIVTVAVGLLFLI